MIENWLYWLVGVIVVIGISLLFEDVRDWFGEIWSYIINFDWMGDISEFFSSMFENISEFSPYGLVFGFLTITLSYSTRYFNLNGTGMGLIESMVQYMSPSQALFWMVTSYVGSFICGYFIGKHFENT